MAATTTWRDKWVCKNILSTTPWIGGFFTSNQAWMIANHALHDSLMFLSMAFCRHFNMQSMQAPASQSGMPRADHSEMHMAYRTGFEFWPVFTMMLAMSCAKIAHHTLTAAGQCLQTRFFPPRHEQLRDETTSHGNNQDLTPI